MSTRSNRGAALASSVAVRVELAQLVPALLAFSCIGCSSDQARLVPRAQQRDPSGVLAEMAEMAERDNGLGSNGASPERVRAGAGAESERSLAGEQQTDSRPSVGKVGDSGADATGKARVEPQAVSVRFEARLGGQAFACGRSQSGVGVTGARVEPIDLRFFVQEVALVDRDGRAVPMRFDERLPWQISDVALLDFEDATSGCVSGSPGTNEVITGSVPAGDYRGLELVVGVPEALNHADPATAPAPLQAGGMSWGWLLGHKFLVAELLQQAQPSPLDAGVAGGAFSDAAVEGAFAADESGFQPPAVLGHGLLHLGSTACSGNPGAGSVECGRSNRVHVHFDEFDVDAHTVVVDVAEIFGATDLTEPAQCHSSGTLCSPLFERLGLSYPEGTPIGGQRAFRAETESK